MRNLPCSPGASLAPSLCFLASLALLGGCPKGPFDPACFRAAKTTCTKASDACHEKTRDHRPCGKERLACYEAARGRCGQYDAWAKAQEQRQIDWRSHETLRTVSVEGPLRDDAPPETHVAGGLHHVGFAIESLSLGRVPGVLGESPVAIGLEVRGLIPDKAVRILFPPVITGADGTIHARDLQRILPVVYPGRNLTFTLSVVPLADPDEYENVQGRTAGAATPLNPYAEASVRLHSMIHLSVFSPHRRSQAWRYSFTLYPAASVYRDKPELLLLAGRTVFLLRAPGAKRIRPEQVVLRGGQLLWKDGERPVTEASYFVLAVQRFERYQGAPTEAHKVLASARALLDAGKPERAKEMLGVGLLALSEAAMLSQNEKNLLRSLHQVLAMRAEAVLAKQKGDAATGRARVGEWAAALAAHKKEWDSFLTPEEKAELARDEGDLAAARAALGN